MAGGGSVSGGNEEGGRERVGEPPLVHVHVLALPATALPAIVSRLEAAVPRKARSCLPRAAPSAWWSYRIPVLPPPPPAENPVAEEEEGRRLPRPQRVRVAPSPDLATAAAAEKPARRCLRCGAAETPQWRAGPMGRGTLCNACGVWYSTTRALPEHRPAASPAADSAPDSPIWEPEVPGAIYLVRKSAKQRRPPRTEAAPAPLPRPATSCLHCGSSEPPSWREGPMGRGVVCNACGGRYKKGRLLPECHPAASPVADPLSESPDADSPPESPIWEPQAPAPAVYPARKPAKRGRTPRKKKRSCLHCGSSETPQWREGPMGRGTLCNACGVRYKQGRLLPEYRPVASPTFVPSKHANSHRRVLQLHRQRRREDQHPPPPPPVDSAINLPPVRDDHPTDKPGRADEHPTDAPGRADEHPVDARSSLDSLLLDGPSAPLIVESDAFLVS